MKKITVIFAGMVAMAAAQPALAHDHGHMDAGMINPCSMDMHHQTDKAQVEGRFLVKKDIDGYSVSFRVMKAKEGMQYGGSHNLMVKVEKDGEALTDIAMNSKVSHPNEKSESKMMMKMGDWYMAAYDLGHPGSHQLMVLFKTSDGQKHFVGVRYPQEQQQ